MMSKSQAPGSGSTASDNGKIEQHILYFLSFLWQSFPAPNSNEKATALADFAILLRKCNYELLGPNECLVNGTNYTRGVMDKYHAKIYLNEGKAAALQDGIQLVISSKIHDGSVELLNTDENFTLVK